MTYLSIIEKFQILFNTLLDFKFILIFTIALLLFTLLYIVGKLSGKKYILFMILSFLIVFGISIINNYEVLSNTFDNFTTILFGNIYFPSIYAYIGVLVISFISFMISILNVMLKKIYKIINSTMFIINNVLLIIVINIIAKNKIDIFSVNSLYTNTNLVAILELSMGLFILWILSLITVYVTDCLCERLAHKQVRNIESAETRITFNPILEVNNDVEPEINNPLSAPISSINSKEEFFNEISSVKKDISNIEQENTIAVEAINEENANVIEENTTLKELQKNNINNDTAIFNDTLDGITVSYYDSGVKEEYHLIDPQMLYEDKYNKIKDEHALFNNIDISLKEDKDEKIELSVEEKTLKEKEKAKEERLINNTISLNDLIDIEANDNTNKLEIELPKNNTDLENIIDNKDEVGYTIDDYKKIIKMLKSLKIHSTSTNINIDDAIAISLINNYSIDDCMKFKKILESNLN